LAFARDGRGGDITLNTPAFFGESYRPAPKGTDPNTLENNNQVDVNATGLLSMESSPYPMSALSKTASPSYQKIRLTPTAS
jgi:hypothetical protein